MPKMPFNWNCPDCFHPQVVTDENYFAAASNIENGEGALGSVRLDVTSILCLNPKCRKLYLSALLGQKKLLPNGNWTIGARLHEWRLLPESQAKPQPDYIPLPLREDYFEACRIRDLSPKASATLARRCLQGMIRDFCGISKGRLIDEIRELRKLVNEEHAPRGVTHESVDAIDHVRSIGNIGAHMESDVNLIIEIDPDEAQALIGLIEMLFVEWYVERKARRDRFVRIAAIGAEKKQQPKKGQAAPEQEPPKWEIGAEPKELMARARAGRSLGHAPDPCEHTRGNVFGRLIHGRCNSRGYTLH
jgi:hypothetical protein